MSRDDVREASPWRRPSIWLGLAELGFGAALGLGGCYASVAADMSMAGVGVLFSLCGAFMFVMVPGALLLLTPRWFRWYPQIAPLAVLVWLALSLG